MSEVSISHSFWKISLIVDLLPYKQLLMGSIRDLRTVTKLTFRTIQEHSPSFTSTHIGHFNDINNAVAHLNKTRRKLEETFKSYTLLRRRKRGLFNFLGEGLQFLFGVATERDFKDIKEALISLKKHCSEALMLSSRYVQQSIDTTS